MILLVSPFNEKARQWIRGRKGLMKKIESTIDPALPLIWFHCSSLGEFEQGRPLIESIRKREPGRNILLTFYSPSGYEIRKDYPGQTMFFTCLLIPEEMQGGSSACSISKRPILSNMNSGITC